MCVGVYTHSLCTHTHTHTHTHTQKKKTGNFFGFRLYIFLYIYIYVYLGAQACFAGCSVEYLGFRAGLVFFLFSIFSASDMYINTRTHTLKFEFLQTRFQTRKKRKQTRGFKAPELVAKRGKDNMP